MRLSQKIKVVAGLIVFQLLASHNVLAATQSVTLSTRVTVVQTCAITATQMNFGNMATIVGTEAAASNVKVTCSAGTPYSVSFRPNLVMTTGIATLVGPGTNILAQVTLATSTGTGTGSHIMNGVLQVKPYPTPGIYQNTFLIYVNY